MLLVYSLAAFFYIALGHFLPRSRYFERAAHFCSRCWRWALDQNMRKSAADWNDRAEKCRARARHLRCDHGL